MFNLQLLTLAHEGRQQNKKPTDCQCVNVLRAERDTEQPLSWRIIERNDQGNQRTAYRKVQRKPKECFCYFVKQNYHLGRKLRSQFELPHQMYKKIKTAHCNANSNTVDQKSCQT